MPSNLARSGRAGQGGNIRNCRLSPKVRKQLLAAGCTPALAYGAAIGRPTRAACRQATRAAVRAGHGGTNKAAPDIALGLLGGCWRSDPGAVWQLAPLLEVARRCRTGNMPWASWNRAWAGTTRASGPAGRCKEALAELGLGGTTTVRQWKGTLFNPRLHSETRDQEVLLKARAVSQAAQLAKRRPKHLPIWLLTDGTRRYACKVCTH